MWTIGSKIEEEAVVWKMIAFILYFPSSQHIYSFCHPIQLNGVYFLFVEYFVCPSRTTIFQWRLYSFHVSSVPLHWAMKKTLPKCWCWVSHSFFSVRFLYCCNSNAFRALEARSYSIINAHAIVEWCGRYFYSSKIIVQCDLMTRLPVLYLLSDERKKLCTLYNTRTF